MPLWFMEPRNGMWKLRCRNKISFNCQVLVNIFMPIDACFILITFTNWLVSVLTVQFCNTRMNILHPCPILPNRYDPWMAWHDLYDSYNPYRSWNNGSQLVNCIDIYMLMISNSAQMFFVLKAWEPKRAIYSIYSSES